MDASRAALQQAIGGFRISQLIFVAAKLRLADHLAAGPQSVEQLAQASGAHEETLYRVLRALAGIGIFVEEDGGRFRLTPSSEHLRSDAPDSLRVVAEVVGEDWMWRAWGGLLHSVKTGETAFDHEYGESTWDWFTAHPADAALFDQFMETITAIDARAIVDTFDFAPFRTVIDVAGGRGTLLESILRRCASVRGILFNLPRVIGSTPRITEPEVATRLELIAGDFFESVPSGGDAYILKNILHDWNDDRARDVLASCHRAMTPGARLLIIEQLVCGPNQPCPGKIGDIQMLVRVGGRNRTEHEFRRLLESGGFHMHRIVPTGAGPDIIEAARDN